MTEPHQDKIFEPTEQDFTGLSDERNGTHCRKEKGRGAKTFRRGRALEFLARMYVRRDTLKQQLETPELQSINPILVGELKAVEMVIAEFAQLFEIHQDEIAASSTHAPPELKVDGATPSG